MSTVIQVMLHINVRGVLDGYLLYFNQALSGCLLSVQVLAGRGK